ncbi:MAG: DNA mismatch repair endonuclease MutL, partial [Myxococcota bacterium]|nr:DNA mismatch repair endonuclease MutL [Myxococcota bacterium]
MRPVRILPDDLADQIAAGEVVERPASVVKELVENAIDAGARAIKVEIEGGGIGLVRVSDDGHGMIEADARLAIRRHATSKISVREDLDRIATLGFRGEALPSIASVSRFTLATRTRDAVAGTEVRIEGGAEATAREVGCAPGTTVTVRDLFFNVPARRKFLKAVGTESAHVRETLVRAALGSAELRITLVRDGRTALELLPVAELGKRASLLFPEESLARVEGVRDGIELEALLSPPERARSGAAHLHLYVNGRPVRDRALARSVAFAYGSVLPPGRYPVGVVYLRIPPERVDVNVHPQKSEVRFDSARTVFDAISRVLAHGLGTS